MFELLLVEMCCISFLRDAKLTKIMLFISCKILWKPKVISGYFADPHKGDSSNLGLEESKNHKICNVLKETCKLERKKFDPSEHSQTDVWSINYKNGCWLVFTKLHPPWKPTSAQFFAYAPCIGLRESCYVKNDIFPSWDVCFGNSKFYDFWTPRGWDMKNHLFPGL